MSVLETLPVPPMPVWSTFTVTWSDISDSTRRRWWGRKKDV